MTATASCWPYVRQPAPVHDHGFDHRSVHDLFGDGTIRYPTADEERRFCDYAAGFPARFAALRDVERATPEVCRETVELMRRGWPTFEKHHDMAWAKNFRDLDLYAKVLVQAMLLNDVNYQDEKAIYWIRTILAAFDFTPAFNRDCFTFFRDGYRKRLRPESWELFAPHLERLLAVMTDFPEPANPRV
jgi:hypothetical protein